MTGAKDRYYVYNRNVYYRNYDRAGSLITRDVISA